MHKTVHLHICPNCGPSAKLIAKAIGITKWEVNAVGKRLAKYQQYEPELLHDPWRCCQCGMCVPGEDYYQGDASIPQENWPGAFRVIRYYAQKHVPLGEMPKVYVSEPVGEAPVEAACTQNQDGSYIVKFNSMEWNLLADEPEP